VDGKEVFRGETSQSLGYVNIPVKPTRGKSVSIELIGSTVNRDAFGQIVEVENQANTATVGGANKAQGNLTIIEAEIFAPAGQPGIEANSWQPLIPVVSTPPLSNATTSSDAPKVSTATSRPAATKPVEARLVAPGTMEKLVAFRVAAGNSYVTAISGGLNTSGKRIGNLQTFVLVDLNGGDLVNGDAVQIKLAPSGSRATYWQESDGSITRVGGNPRAGATFKIKLKAKSAKDAPQSIVLQTASGKFVSVPAGGAVLATTDTENKATILDLVDVAAIQ
jgi:hypothetical protein